MIQLGTRWGFGTTPPPRLAGPVADEIVRVEQSLRTSATDPEALDGRVWTLTWLEGRPIAELDLDGDDGDPVVVALGIDGTVSTPSAENGPDEIW